MKKIIFVLCICSFFIIFVSSSAFTGAPPGAKTKATIPMGATKKAMSEAFGIELEYYWPSLDKFNQEMLLMGNPEVSINPSLSFLYYNPAQYFYMALRNSTGNSSSEKRDYKLWLWSYTAGVPIPVPVPVERLGLWAILEGSCVLGGWDYNYIPDMYTYTYATLGIGWSAGVKVRCEYLVVPNIGLSTTFGKTFLGEISKVKVSSSNNENWEVDNVIVGNDRANLCLELDGWSINLGVNFHF